MTFDRTSSIIIVLANCLNHQIWFFNIIFDPSKVAKWDTKYLLERTHFLATSLSASWLIFTLTARSLNFWVLNHASTCKRWLECIFGSWTMTHRKHSLPPRHQSILIVYQCLFEEHASLIARKPSFKEKIFVCSHLDLLTFMPLGTPLVLLEHVSPYP